jgi:hypothetical protein
MAGALGFAPSESDLAITILMIGTVPNNFSAPCPSWFTISSPFFHEQDAKDGNIKRIRWGEAFGATLSLAEGWAASKLSGSNLPLMGTAIVVGLLIFGYEFSLAHPATEDGQ